MTNRDRDRRQTSPGKAIGRRDILKAGGYLSGAALLGTKFTRVVAASGKTLTIGNIGWDENVALAYLSKVLLEHELGYQRVDVAMRDVDRLFSGVADGSLDTFQDVWLPKTHRQYWQQYGDKVVRLAPWYQGSATLGLTVPDYVEAETIDDLNVYARRFGGEIVGIEPGAGEMRIVKNDVMPGYNLNDYKLSTGTTPQMLDRLEKALRSRAPIVVTLYKPHWAFSVYRIRYLDDPKRLISGHRERLYSIVRQGLQKEKPDAYAFFKAIQLTPAQLGRLELSIKGAPNPEVGVERWLHADQAFGGANGINRQLVEPWIRAARRARA